MKKVLKSIFVVMLLTASLLMGFSQVNADDKIDDLAVTIEKVSEQNLDLTDYVLLGSNTTPLNDLVAKGDYAFFVSNGATPIPGGYKFIVVVKDGLGQIKGWKELQSYNNDNYRGPLNVHFNDEFITLSFEAHETMSIELYAEKKLTSDIPGAAVYTSQLNTNRFSIELATNGGEFTDSSIHKYLIAYKGDTYETLSTYSTVSLSYEHSNINDYLPSRQGYKFLGWEVQRESGAWELVNFETEIAKVENKGWNRTVFRALWAQNFTVEFETYGGTSIVDQGILSGDKAIMPESPSLSNHSFKGWYTDANYTTMYDFDLPIISDIILHAKWEENLYNVDYDLAGGVADFETTDSVNQSEYTIVDSTPQKEGYTFLSWMYEDDNGIEYELNPSDKVMVSSNMVFVAQWKEIVEPVAMLPTTGMGNQFLIPGTLLVLFGTVFILFGIKKSMNK